MEWMSTEQQGVVFVVERHVSFWICILKLEKACMLPTVLM